jgi:hypothetical protein
MAERTQNLLPRMTFAGKNEEFGMRLYQHPKQYIADGVAFYIRQSAMVEAYKLRIA